MKINRTLFILILLVAISSYAQNNKSFTFPEKIKEYSIVFPQQPIITQIYKDSIRESWQAQLVLSSGMMRALITSLTPTEVENIWLKTDADLSKVGMDYAKNNGISNSSVKSGTNKLGKYVVVKGNKQNNDKSLTMEVYFYWGKKESIALTTLTYADKYPTPEIITFLNSLKGVTPINDVNTNLNGTLQNFNIKTSNYTDDKFPFSISYPSDWTTIKPSFPEIRVKAFGEDADFSVIVIFNKEVEQMTAEEFVDGMSENNELAEMLIKKDVPTAKITSKEKTYLNNRVAYMLKGSGIYRNLDIEEQVIILQIVTFHKGSIYLLSFRSGKSSFDANFPVFRFMASTFVIRNKV